MALLSFLLSPSSGCVLFSLEPPCTSDEHCDGPRRCDVDAGVCAEPVSADDGGAR